MVCIFLVSLFAIAVVLQCTSAFRLCVPMPSRTSPCFSARLLNTKLFANSDINQRLQSVRVMTSEPGFDFSTIVKSVPTSPVKTHYRFRGSMHTAYLWYESLSAAENVAKSLKSMNPRALVSLFESKDKSHNSDDNSNSNRNTHSYRNSYSNSNRISNTNRNSNSASSSSKPLRHVIASDSDSDRVRVRVRVPSHNRESINYNHNHNHYDYNNNTFNKFGKKIYFSSNNNNINNNNSNSNNYKKKTGSYYEANAMNRHYAKKPLNINSNININNNNTKYYNTKNDNSRKYYNNNNNNNINNIKIHNNNNYDKKTTHTHFGKFLKSNSVNKGNGNALHTLANGNVHTADSANANAKDSSDTANKQRVPDIRDTYRRFVIDHSDNNNPNPNPNPNDSVSDTRDDLTLTQSDRYSDQLVREREAASHFKVYPIEVDLNPGQSYPILLTMALSRRGIPTLDILTGSDRLYLVLGDLVDVRAALKVLRSLTVNGFPIRATYMAPQVVSANSVDIKGIAPNVTHQQIVSLVEAYGGTDMATVHPIFVNGMSQLRSVSIDVFKTREVLGLLRWLFQNRDAFATGVFGDFSSVNGTSSSNTSTALGSVSGSSGGSSGSRDLTPGDATQFHYTFKPYFVKGVITFNHTVSGEVPPSQEDDMKFYIRQHLSHRVDADELFTGHKNGRTFEFKKYFMSLSKAHNDMKMKSEEVRVEDSEEETPPPEQVRVAVSGRLVSVDMNGAVQTTREMKMSNQCRLRYDTLVVDGLPLHTSEKSFLSQVRLALDACNVSSFVTLVYPTTVTGSRMGRVYLEQPQVTPRVMAEFKKVFEKCHLNFYERHWSETPDALVLGPLDGTLTESGFESLVKGVVSSEQTVKDDPNPNPNDTPVEASRRPIAVRTSLSRPMDDPNKSPPSPSRVYGLVKLNSSRDLFEASRLLRGVSGGTESQCTALRRPVIGDRQSYTVYDLPRDADPFVLTRRIASLFKLEDTIQVCMQPMKDFSAAHIRFPNIADADNAYLTLCSNFDFVSRDYYLSSGSGDRDSNSGDVRVSNSNSNNISTSDRVIGELGELGEGNPNPNPNDNNPNDNNPNPSPNPSLNPNFDYDLSQFDSGLTEYFQVTWKAMDTEKLTFDKEKFDY